MEENALFATAWVHAFEEDGPEGAVYRPEGPSVRLSRRPRERLSFSRGGRARLLVGGPDDRLRELEASWREDAGEITVTTEIRLEGEYYAVAPVVLTAARAQILMTLFANAAVQSARVTINGDNIANISISHSMDAKPHDYAYTRAEIEAFMAENTYFQP